VAYLIAQNSIKESSPFMSKKLGRRFYPLPLIAEYILF